ncbi:hypothetical protein CNYM01_12046 [Colletotrichum nymphaeae SA-01]|uniref:Uncharacterized protein n=1 Tax=Colletotrichum nymphaeae SA-01 TaxID=1460502 RepID=A0A135RVF2_9PEZI|nr:hypothetical protein CNYM01_12046 [Colletotrichum nymphaeae SA-01]
MNGTTKAPNAFPAPNQSQLTPESMPGLTPPQQVPAHNGAGPEFLQGMNITLQGHRECLGRQMQTWKGSYSLDSRWGALQQLVANTQPGLKRSDWLSALSDQPQPQFPGQGASHQQPETQLKAQLQTQPQGVDWSDLDWLVNFSLGTAAIAQEQIDLLFDEMDGSDNTQQEQVQAFDQMIMSSVLSPNVDAPGPWVSSPSTTFEDVFRQQDEEAGVELGPYSSMLFGPGHSMSGSG